MQHYNFDVDIVIPWVDGSDKKWILEKNKYLDPEHQIDIDAHENRYRDWGNVQYIFRGIEKFAPWVHKVYFITCGQIPKWMNINNEKLVLVNHKDYIPEEYLPTFSANPIELNMHRIKGLSEHFIYMNDDFFFIKPVQKSDFFNKNGLPKIMAMEIPRPVSQNRIFDNICFNNVRVISSKFDKKKTKKAGKRNWYSLKNIPALIINLVFDRLYRNQWSGFNISHGPAPFLKSAINDCWADFNEELNATSSNKFRSINDVNQYIFTEYLLCKNLFVQRKFRPKPSRLVSLKDENLASACHMIEKQKYKAICLNDDLVTSFNVTRSIINKAFDKILPEKSSFEI